MIANVLNDTQRMIGGVIVTYHPEIAQFLKVFEAATKQLDLLIVVNNSTSAIQLDFDTPIQHAFKNFEIIENGENLGIASALNIGLKALIEKGCSHFLMLDQDSFIPDGMVTSLIESLEVLNRQGHRVAAIGPAYFHTHLDKYAPFIQFGKLSLKKINVDHRPRLVETHFLITSGSLITLDALQNVGLMEEELFIDLVDTEWCLRALHKQYKLYGFSGMKMKHSLGDAPISLFGKKFSMHSPLRHYYIARNTMHLIKKTYIPFNWRFIILARMLKSFILYSLIPPNRLEHFLKMLRGLKDGVNGRLGRYE